MAKTKAIKKQNKLLIDCKLEGSRNKEKQPVPVESYNTKLRVCKFLKFHPE